jgi:hypothetical protein
VLAKRRIDLLKSETMPLCMMPKNYKKVGLNTLMFPWVAWDMSLAGLDVEEIIVMNYEF